VTLLIYEIKIAVKVVRQSLKSSSASFVHDAMTYLRRQTSQQNYTMWWRIRWRCGDEYNDARLWTVSKFAKMPVTSKHTTAHRSREWIPSQEGFKKLHCELSYEVALVQ